jgi:drug/metabolite transporter (DMT)-like permease
VKGWRSAIGFIALAIVWGGGYPAIRAAVRGIDPLFLAAVRFDLVGLLVLGFAIYSGRRWWPARGDWGSILVGGGLLVALHNGLLFVAQARITSAVGAVIISTVPILSVAFAIPRLSDARPTPVRLFGILLGLVGVGIIVAPPPGAIASPDPIGVGLMFVSAAVFAFASVEIRHRRTDLPVTSLQGWMMLVGGPSLHAGSLAVGERQAMTFEPGVLVGFCYLVVVAGVVGYLLYFTLLDTLGPVEINLVGYVEPIVAAVVGWLALGEAIAPNTVVGFVVIVVGFTLVKRRALATTVREVRTR